MRSRYDEAMNDDHTEALPERGQAYASKQVGEYESITSCIRLAKYVYPVGSDLQA